MSDLFGNPEDRFSRVTAHMFSATVQPHITLSFGPIETDHIVSESIL